MTQLMAGTNSSEIKTHNLNAILLTLLRQKGISRVHLAQQLKVSSATITNLVTELREAGLVMENGTIKNQLGRPQKALHLIPNARHALAIHIDVGQVHLALTNLRAEIQHTVTLQHPLREAPDRVLEKIAHAITDLLQYDASPVVGMGIAASGLVDTETGVNIFAPNLDWHHVPLAEYFAERFHLPVAVDNNVRAMALGEAMFGAAASAQVLAFVYARVGVGSGLVVNGQLYRGAGAGAGEIGHTILEATDFCQQKVVTTLEKLVSEPTMLQNAQTIAHQHPHSPFAQVFLAHPKLNTLFDLGRHQDEFALQILARCACYMGLALANLVNLFNPEVIILGGIFASGDDLLIPTAEAVMREQAFAHLGKQVELRVSSFQDHAGTTGAAALALDRFFYRAQTEVTL